MNPGWRKNYLRYRSYFLNVATQYRERADLKVYLEIFLSLATVIIFTLFALRPTLTTIAELVKEIESKKETLAVMEAKLQKISEASSIYHQKKSNIDLVKLAVPETASPDIFVRHIEGLSIKNNNLLNKLSLDKNEIIGTSPKAASGKKTSKSSSGSGDSLVFNVAVSNSLNDYRLIHGFLTDMEKLRRPVEIDTVTLSRVIDEQTNVSELLLDIKGSVPFHKSKE
jgi:hypothetical protein